MTQNTDGTGGSVAIAPGAAENRVKLIGMIVPNTASLNIRVQQIDPFTQQPKGDPKDDVPAVTNYGFFSTWSSDVGNIKASVFAPGSLWRVTVVTTSGGQSQTKIHNINVTNN